MIGRFAPITVLCLLIPLFSGCASASGRTPSAGDPLLLGPPLPAKPAGIARPALAEPVQAARPAESVAASSVVTPASAMGPPLPAVPALRSGPVPAAVNRRPHAPGEGSLHAEREAYDLPTDASTPAAERSRPAAAPAGVYGHAADYSWLRGKVDRPYSGGVKLRFCDPAEEQRWGGCVFLTGEPALNGLREGSVVEVRGRLLPPAMPAGDSIYSYPSYQVHGFTVVPTP